MTNRYSGARHKGFYTLEEAEGWLTDKQPPSAQQMTQPAPLPKSEPGEDKGPRETSNNLGLAENDRDDREIQKLASTPRLGRSRDDAGDGGHGNTTAAGTNRGKGGRGRWRRYPPAALSKLDITVQVNGDGGTRSGN